MSSVLSSYRRGRLLFFADGRDVLALSISGGGGSRLGSLFRRGRPGARHIAWRGLHEGEAHDRYSKFREMNTREEKYVER